MLIVSLSKSLAMHTHARGMIPVMKIACKKSTIPITRADAMPRRIVRTPEMIVSINMIFLRLNRSTRKPQRIATPTPPNRDIPNKVLAYPMLRDNSFVR